MNFWGLFCGILTMFLTLLESRLKNLYSRARRTLLRRVSLSRAAASRCLRATVRNACVSWIVRAKVSPISIAYSRYTQS